MDSLDTALSSSFGNGIFFSKAGMKKTPKSKERWKRVKGYTNYIVSTLGRLKNNSTGKFICPYKGRKNRPRVSLYIGSSKHNVYLYDIVLTTFIGPRPKKYFACHINDDAWDNRLCNLVWGPQSLNERQKVKNRMVSVAEIYGYDQSYKLTDNSLLEILASPRDEYYKALLAIRFGVDRYTIDLVWANQCMVPLPDTTITNKIPF